MDTVLPITVSTQLIDRDHIVTVVAPVKSQIDSFRLSCNANESGHRTPDSREDLRVNTGPQQQSQRKRRKYVLGNAWRRREQHAA